MSRFVIQSTENLLTFSSSDNAAGPGALVSAAGNVAEGYFQHMVGGYQAGKDQCSLPHELEGGPDEGGGDDVVDEEGAVVGQEDALPPELVLATVVTDHGLEERPDGRSQGKKKRSN